MPRLVNFVRNNFLAVCLVLALGTVIGWFVVRLGTALFIAQETFNVSLANDAETGKYLGEVVEEIREEETAKVIGYRIRRSDGSIEERRAETVVLFKP